MQGLPISHCFVGRATELGRLKDHLKPLSIRFNSARKVVALQGPPGIGKTQLAIQYCREFNHVYSGIFWVDCSSAENLVRTLAETARRVNQGELGHHARAFVNHDIVNLMDVSQNILDWLSLPTNKNWLMVFDNVDQKAPCPDGTSIGDYFPTADHGE
jgi:ATP/maltotriose-dependent transcriptional regulator MalT